MGIEDPRQIIFFDGVCNLCNAYVDFLFRFDRKNNFYFAPLQGETAKLLLTQARRDSLRSLVFYRGGQSFVKSGAVLRILIRLGFPWNLFGAFLLIPPAIRDACYDLVASYRYSLFGKRETCRLPNEQERARFLG